MKNNGLFSTLFIEELKEGVELDDAAKGRMATLAQTWRTRKMDSAESVWDTFLKQAVSYLQFVPPTHPDAPCVYSLYEEWGYSECIAILYLVKPGGDIDDTAVGRFYPAKLLAQLRSQKLNWGILTDGARWRLYSTKSARPHEDYVELPLAEALEGNDEAEYGLFERFFHKDSFVPEKQEGEAESTKKDEAAGVYKCRLDLDREQSETILGELVKAPFLYQVDEVLQYLCNGFIHDTPKKGDEYTEEERAEIFESAVKLLYRCLFLFYAEARRLLPSDAEKADVYQRHSIRALCHEARKFRWGKRKDFEHYDLWKHLKGLVSAVNDGDPEYGIMGYNGGLFDDSEEKFLGEHQLRNDFLARALYLMAYVEPFSDEDDEYEIPYEDLEVRHLGELYENILEYTVMLADADRIRRRMKKGVELLLASQTKRQQGDTFIRKGDVFFGESAFERKQTGSYYTPESLVRFLNQKTIIQPLIEKFEKAYRKRFNEFLTQAVKGHDPQTRRGAAHSAAALVERFVQEEVLKFKACDLAMGSGHFLVDAANQMAGLVVALLEEIPDVPGLRVSITSQPNAWRRLITRHCLYGVDLNPLAVNLAKLSLWLNCFASDHRLTFLDHHLRQGNSLIGIRSLTQLKKVPKRKKDGKKEGTHPLLFDYDAFSNVLQQASKTVSSITSMMEDDTERQKTAFERAYDEARKRVKPLADLYTAYLMDGDIASDTYHVLLHALAKAKPGSAPNDPRLRDTLDRVTDLARRHHHFHLPLEFPDVFGSDDSIGFTATVGNPPWDIVKPNSQEFFSNYDPAFRSYEKQEANRVAARLMKDNPAIADKWQEYGNGFDEQSTYLKEPESYAALGKGDINTFKLFLERFFTALATGGHMGIVVPSGIYTDEGCLPLRKLFFDHSQVQFLYCFENRNGIFGIHRSYKFVLFGTDKGGKTSQFKTAFMEHDPERLPAIEANALRMAVGQVKKFSPSTLSVMEFNSQEEIALTSKLYGEWPLLGEEQENTWNVKFSSELHMTNDSHLFVESGDITDPCKFVRLYEGKQIWLLTDTFAEPIRFVAKQDIRHLSSVSSTRVAYRALAASTNERTLIATVIPAGAPAGHSINVCPLPEEDCCFLAAILSSLVVDWVIRRKVTTNLTMFYLYQLPVPRTKIPEDIRSGLVARAARLVCCRSDFAEVWSRLSSGDWRRPDFWYPSRAKLDYGPRNEQKSRQSLRESARTLSDKWTSSYGLYDRLPDSRDTGDRAQVRAEIDAYVAHLYGLSRDDFADILDTFPVLRRKEEQAFGEFMSKRKCLEEYDRLAQVLT